MKRKFVAKLKKNPRLQKENRDNNFINYRYLFFERGF